MHQETLKTLKMAYLQLLRAGSYPSRHTQEGQRTLGRLRDAITQATERDGQEVQEDFEEVALSLNRDFPIRHGLRWVLN